ncbi:hypothetical protein BDA99DRAFT_608875 [Phascolomyces articulosus]|uniref:Heterokaryon incompatibility domain-containing protein n=1 Tax=Phascolomyces articulosus TaxID=60185 RepID=A0AAD5JZ69_9FUNG|nr:hypothetical protein BDA99DRAFT_608875 [Phascolomyces articulosus]
MYIKYCVNQRSADVIDTTDHRFGTTGGTYRPTWLIRTLDWKKVPGIEAKNGYCAFSYCWEQSGEVVRKNNKSSSQGSSSGEEKSECIDKGLHCITKHKKERRPSNLYLIPQEKTVIVKLARFDRVVQQICKDFEIDYLWYDKLCMGDGSPDNYINEIKQIYMIYGHARYTVAFVPEVHVENPKEFGRFDSIAGIKARSDALNQIQESLCENIPSTCDFLSNKLLGNCDSSQGRNGGSRTSINQALWEAHFRTSTKQLDKIFSLTNIFLDMFEHLKISYESNPQTLFNQFYRNVATNDLSILCFGSILYPNGSEITKNMMLHHHLPSWTGVAGRHTPYRVTTTATITLPHFIDDVMQLHITSYCSWTIPLVSYDLGCFSTKPLLPDIADKQSPLDQAATKRRASAPLLFSSTKNTTMMPPINGKTKATIGSFADMLNHSGCHATHYSSPQAGTQNATEIKSFSSTEDCKECTVLPIVFVSHQPVHTRSDGEPVANQAAGIISDFERIYFLPVFAKGFEDRYRAVGIALVGRDNGVNAPLEPDKLLNSLFKDSFHEQNEFIVE